jgi:hypothetical protein
MVPKIRILSRIFSYIIPKIGRSQDNFRIILLKNRIIPISAITDRVGLVDESKPNISTELRNALLQAIINYEAEFQKNTANGNLYIILFPMTRNNKTEIIKSVWIIRPDEDFPRLVTCYINE